MFKISKGIIAILTAISTVIFIATPTIAEESIRYKSTNHQTIKRGKWTTLEFKGNNALAGNGQRSLFCYQVGIDTKGKKKPKYVKVRLARLKSPLDTTATNYYPVPAKPSSELVFSNCWEIETNSPVIVQVRITGGSKTYISDVRQFKMWTPGADYPADFSDMIPDATL